MDPVGTRVSLGFSGRILSINEKKTVIILIAIPNKIISKYSNLRFSSPSKKEKEQNSNRIY